MLKLKKALSALDDAFQQQDLEEYNRLGEQFFENWLMVDDVSKLERSFTVASGLLEATIARQEKKLEDLMQCWPPAKR